MAISTVCIDREVVLRPTFWVVLVAATMACAADVVRISVTSSADRLPQERWPRVLCLLTGFAVFAIWWTSIVFAGAAPGLQLVLGLLIAGVGGVIRRRAVALLGSDFVSDVESERIGQSALLTNGLYARVRHPSELGLALVTLGAVMAASSSVGLAVWMCLLMPLSYLRIRLEETHLRERFGNAYFAYERRAGPYLPRIL